MAEGLLRHLGEGRFDVASAGTEPTTIRPLAIRVMEELGIDISGQDSKSVDRCMGEDFDVVVTVCAESESCPIPPKAKRILHWPLPDPSKAEGEELDRLYVYRVTRDLLRRRIEEELLA